jgi:hypothetical protein
MSVLSAISAGGLRACGAEVGGGVLAAAVSSVVGNTAAGRGDSVGGIVAGSRGGGPADRGGRMAAGEAARLAFELREEEEEEGVEGEGVDGVGGVVSDDLDAEADLKRKISCQNMLQILIWSQLYPDPLVIGSVS